jgi:Trehalose utilisation
MCAVRNTCFVVLMGWLVLPGAAAERKRVVLIGHDPDHPYRTHCYLPDCELLAKCLRQHPDVEAVVSRGWPTDPTVLEGVDAIALHVRQGGDLIFHPTCREQAAALLKQGVGLTAIHWSTGASLGEMGDRYQAALGGLFHTDFAQYTVEQSTIRRAFPDHPVSRGWQDYDLTEEFYINLRFQPGVAPVMVAKVRGEDFPIGWVYERPDSNGGRSFGFVGGHFHDNFQLEPFRRGIVNGILWTAHGDVPEEGAACAVEPADFDLSAEFEALRPK